MNRILFFILTVVTFLSCSESYEKEIIGTYYDKTPKNIQYFKWDGDKKVVVKEETLFPDGNIQESKELKDGLKHGQNIIYNEGGVKWIVENYDNGIRNGYTVVFYKNKEKFYEGYYKDGKPTKTWIYYDENGNIEKEVNY